MAGLVALAQRKLCFKWPAQVQVPRFFSTSEQGQTHDKIQEINSQQS